MSMKQTTLRLKSRLFDITLKMTCALTICIWCDHLLIGHYTCCSIIHLKIGRGGGRKQTTLRNMELLIQ